MNSVEVTCKCGKQKTWVAENKETEPCPECGRRYRGEYDAKKLTIRAVEN